MSDIDNAAEALRKEPLADLGKLLKPGGRQEVLSAIAQVEKQGRRARVVITPPDAALSSYREVWGALRLDPKKDLLLLFDGKGKAWEARGWGLSGAQVTAALESARPGLQRYYARGLVDALAALAVASGAERPAPAKETASGGSGGLFLGGAALLGLGTLGFVIVRRRRRAKEASLSLGDAKSSAEQVFSEVMLASEELPEADAAMLRERAGRLKGELDALPTNLKALPPKEESLTRARFEQLENELEALRSVVYQKKRKA